MATKKPPSLLRMLRFAALLLVVYGLWHLAQAFTFLQNSLPTNGIILEFTYNDAPFNPEQTPVIAYVDYMGARHLEIPENALDTGGLVAGQKIAILYDGYNPQYLRLDTPLGVWGTGGIWFLIGLASFIFFNAFMAVARKRSRPSRPTPTRGGSIEALHLLGHDVDATDIDRPVVRRMR